MELFPHRHLPLESKVCFNGKQLRTRGGGAVPYQFQANRGQISVIIVCLGLDEHFKAL